MKKKDPFLIFALSLFPRFIFKRKFYLSILLFSTILAPKAQAKYHIVYSNAVDTCNGFAFINTAVDSTIYTLKLKIYYGDGYEDTNTLAFGYASKLHRYTIPGTYTIKVVVCDATFTIRYDSLSYSHTPRLCTSLYGYIYRDKNNNCVNDTPDYHINVPHSIEVDSAGTPVDTITGYGYFYWYNVHSVGTSFSFKLIDYPTMYLLGCPGPLTATSSTSMVHVGDFGLECATSTSYDVAVQGWMCASPYICEGGAYIHNNSCNTQSGTVTVNIDPRYAHKIYASPGAIVSGSTISWNYTGLDIDHSKYYWVHGAPDSSTPVAIGSSLTTTMGITPFSGDTDTTNNHWTHTDTVKSSWDPNEKDVSPSGNILAGTALTYTIKFENTGNAPAENIHVLDTLAATFDANTVQVITSTHPLIFSSSTAGGKTILKFDFPGIHLLDSSHHGQADGMVVFSIKTKNALSIGTKVDNRAGIYFDANPVVMTNVAENSITDVAVPAVTTGQVNIYPNPVNSELVIKCSTAGYNNATIINTMGQTMWQQSLQPNETHINTRSLIPGMYYIMLRGNSGVKVEKIEKL